MRLYSDDASIAVLMGLDSLVWLAAGYTVLWAVFLLIGAAVAQKVARA